MITIVTWVWHGERAYSLRHADLLVAGLKRYMSVPWRLVVISDRAGKVAGAEVMATPTAAKKWADLRSIEGARFPSSYRRLWLFSDEAKALGDRLLLTDVDVVVTGDWAPLLRTDAPFVAWRPAQKWGAQKRIAGGMWLLRTGAHPEVWQEFRGHRSARLARVSGYRGSDQAWLSYCLVDKAAYWPINSGIYSVRDFTRDRPGLVTTRIPRDARVVHFNGHAKPWDKQARRAHPWLVDFYDRRSLGG